MLKTKILILLLILILLVVGYYNQAFAPAKAPAKQYKNNIVADNTSSKVNPKKLKDVEDKDFRMANQNFEEILKQAAEDTKPDLELADGTKSTGSAQGVVVGGRDGESSGIADILRAGERSSGAAELEALREAAELFQSRSGSSLIPGFRANPVSQSPRLDAVATSVSEPTRAPVNELKNVTGQARGYTMLYLMHPKAKQTVEKQIEAMLRSKVQQLYIGVLTDGTFGKDFNYLSNVVRRINKEGRSLVLSIFLTNGATMRDEDTLVEAPFGDIDPIEFRGRIRFDPTVREDYINLIKPVLPVLQLNRRLNPNNINYVTVMLEDNLDDAAYLEMRTLAQGLIGNRATFIRNPCGGDGCPIDSTRTGLGDPVEVHTLDELKELEVGDAFSLDGTGYRLKGETNELIPSFEEVLAAAVTAKSRGLKYFGLWRFERQGNRKGEAMQPVGERTYEVPSEAAILQEIDILRAGLTADN